MKTTTNKLANALVGLLCAVLISPAIADDKTKLLATGSSTVAPLVAALAKRYESQHPNVRIDVQTGGSSRGVADATRGVVDFGMASRALKASESALHVTTIANDGVTVILHKSNPVKEISGDDLRAIYRGDIKDWGKLGGKAGEEIVVVNKAAGRSTLELFAHYLGVKEGSMYADIIIGDNQQGIKTVGGNPNAVGYVSIGAAREAAASGTPIKVLPIDGIEATLEAVANGTFPISRPLNVVTKEEPAGEVAAFLKFARDPAQNDIVNSLSYVPLHEQ